MATSVPYSPAIPTEEAPQSRGLAIVPRVATVAWLGLNGWFAVAESMDLAIPDLIFLSSTGLLMIVLALWVAFQLAPAARWSIVAAVAFVAIATPLSIRVDEWSGTMWPRKIRLRWWPKSDEGLTQLVGNDGAVLSAVSAPATLPVAPDDAADFAQFLGPKRNSIVNSIKLARNWSRQPPELVWRQRIGAGWSAFSVVSGLAVTQEQRGEQELVTCYHLVDGQPRWAHANDVRFGKIPGGDGPRATPTIAGGKVYALGATGILDCLDLATGKLFWSRDIVTENGAAVDNWGKSGSPLVVDPLVIVSAGGPDGKSLVAYDKDTGQPVWSGGSDPSSYSSPTLATLAGVRQVLIVNEDYLASHDLSDGRVLWRVDWPGKSGANASASQPHALDGDRVFLSKGYGIGGRLMQVQRTGDAWSVTTIWPGEDGGRAVLRTKLNNVAMHDGYIYGLDDGILQCVALDTGKPQWKKGRFGHGQLLLVDDLLLVSTELTGQIALIESSPAGYRELGRFTALGNDLAWNNLCLAGRYLLVRNAVEAACYRLP